MSTRINLKSEEGPQWPERLSSIQAYATVQLVTKKIFSYANQSPEAKQHGLPWLLDNREKEDALNSFYGQTEAGMFLVLQNGWPSYLYTLWGRFEFASSGGGFWDEGLTELLGYFGAKEHRDAQVTYSGEYGPVFALTQIGERSLPTPRELDEHERIPFETAMNAWDDVAARYRRNFRSKV